MTAAAEATSPASTGAASDEAPNYLTHEKGFKSWALTVDHKRIGLMYLASIIASFFSSNGLPGPDGHLGGTKTHAHKCSSGSGVYRELELRVSDTLLTAIETHMVNNPGLTRCFSALDFFVECRFKAAKAAKFHEEWLARTAPAPVQALAPLGQAPGMGGNLLDMGAMGLPNAEVLDMMNPNEDGLDNGMDV